LIQSTFEGFVQAIRIGGDVGTLAPIVVGILAGRYGLSDVPDHLINLTENQCLLTHVSKKFHEFLCNV